MAPPVERGAVFPDALPPSPRTRAGPPSHQTYRVPADRTVARVPYAVPAPGCRTLLLPTAHVRRRRAASTHPSGPPPAPLAPPPGFAPAGSSPHTRWSLPQTIPRVTASCHTPELS